MTMHTETLAVNHFGNSVFFADKLGELPTIFQPFLFYPDWFFMTWPAHLFMALTFSGAHPYHTGIGPVAVGFSIFWLIVGLMLGAFNASATVTEFATIDHYPVSRNLVSKIQNTGILGQLFVLPLIIVNAIYHVVYKVIVYSLFWHIVIARIVGVFLTVHDWLGCQLSRIVRGLLYAAMLVPALVSIVAQIFLLTVRIF